MNLRIASQRAALLWVVAAAGCSSPGPDTNPSDGPSADDPPTPPAKAKEDLGSGRCVGINSVGQILGVGYANSPFIIDSGGDRIDLGTFEDKTTVGLILDDEGVVFGYSDSSDGRIPVEYRQGNWDVPEGLSEQGAILARSTDGAIGGIQYAPSGIRAFVMDSDGSGRPLNFPEDKLSAIYAMTNQRLVGILEVDGGATHAFVFEQEQFEDLGTLGGTNSAALAVNETGDVVGASERSDGVVHAFVRWAGTIELTDLGRLPEAMGSDARGIDAEGRVVMNHHLEDGSTRPQVVDRQGQAQDLLPKEGDTHYFRVRLITS